MKVVTEIIILHKSIQSQMAVVMHPHYAATLQAVQQVLAERQHHNLTSSSSSSMSGGTSTSDGSYSPLQHSPNIEVIYVCIAVTVLIVCKRLKTLCVRACRYNVVNSFRVQ
jgi:hypothetical protein